MNTNVFVLLLITKFPNSYLLAVSGGWELAMACEFSDDGRDGVWARRDGNLLELHSALHQLDYYLSGVFSGIDSHHCKSPINPVMNQKSISSLSLGLSLKESEITFRCYNVRWDEHIGWNNNGKIEMEKSKMKMVIISLMAHCFLKIWNSTLLFAEIKKIQNH